MSLLSIRPAHAVVFFAVACLTACGGDEGDLAAGGATGPQGETGPAGPAGTIDPAQVIQNQSAAPQTASFSITGNGRVGSLEQVSTRNANTDAATDAVKVRTEGTVAGDQFVVKNDGTFMAGGIVRDVGNTTGCAQFLPATGAGTRFMWLPCRGSLRFGRVPTGQTNWDDANLDDFTFAGGNQVTASGYGAFAYGDQVNVSSVVGVGFGSGVTVSGTAGFSAGASNTCSGFACTAIGYTDTATGQGSVALGYRSNATADYGVAIGYRTTTNALEGSVVIGAYNGSTGATVVTSQISGEMRVRAPGGFAFRTSNAASAAAGVAGNTGCDLPAGSGTFSCASSRKLKSGFQEVDGEDVLGRLRNLELTTWKFNEDSTGARHMGPVAEDFRSAYGLGESASSIGVQDLAGVALAAAQALEKRTAELDARTREVGELQALVRAMEKRLERLEGRGTTRRP